MEVVDGFAVDDDPPIAHGLENEERLFVVFAGGGADIVGVVAEEVGVRLLNNCIPDFCALPPIVFVVVVVGGGEGSFLPRLNIALQFDRGNSPIPITEGVETAGAGGGAGGDFFARGIVKLDGWVGCGFGGGGAGAVCPNDNFPC